MEEKRKYIINFFNSLIIYLAISIYINIPFYNTFSLGLFLLILFLYSKSIKNIDKKIKYYSIFLSLVFSITLSIGNIVSKNLLSNNIGFLNYKNIFYIIIMFVGFFLLFYKLSLYLFKNIRKINILRGKKNSILTTKNFIIMFILIFICWFIIFLRFYPAIMTPDSFYVIHNASEKILSDHHTFGHTWFFALFFYIGKSIFSNLNAGVAVYTIFQMIIIDLIFVLSIRYFYNKGLKKCICYLLAIIFAFNPLYSFYSVTLWRDVLFGASFIVILICLYDYVINDFNINKSSLILFTVSIIFMLFFRNNGIYVFIIMSCFIIFIGSKKRVAKLIYCITIIFLYFIVKGPVFNYFKVQKGLPSESYSIPIQQISRVVASGSKIKKSDYSYLTKLYNVKIAKEQYNPIISDKMKETINNDVLKQNKIEFIKVYLSMLIDHPTLYFEAYFTQTLGYWYPDVQYWATAGESNGIFEKEVKSVPLLPKNINRLIDMTTSRKIPFSMLIWSVGLYFEMLVFFTTVSLYKFGKKVLLYYAPFYGLWLSIMVATPVFCEFRYIFGIAISMPFIIVCTFMNDKKNNN